MPTHRPSLPRWPATLALLLPLGLGACAADDPHAEAEHGDEHAEQHATYTWYADTQAIVLERCAGCHVDGDIAPFALTSYEEVHAVRSILAPAIASGSMPPWPPAAGCSDYDHDRSLSAAQRELLLTWLDEGAPEGDPADAAAPPEPPPAWVPDAMIEMPEAYTPVSEPDDYRCFLVDGPELSETSYITGFEVYPGERSVVHHVVAFVVDPEATATFEAYDDADPEAGYGCFGGPTGDSEGGDMPGLSGARWVGSWVPGSSPARMPEGTGMRVEPGSKFVLQMHYNTSSSAPLPDRSAFGLTLDADIERPGMMLPFTNFAWVTGAEPMTIPAGDPSVTHSFSASRSSPVMGLLLQEIGATSEDTLWLSEAGLHMHTLGRKASLALERPEGDDACLLRLDDYDFGWQGGYSLREPVAFGPDDALSISCEWDNSPENQPIIDGEIAEPREVEWGDGTFDEMCLGVVYVSR